MRVSILNICCMFVSSLLIHEKRCTVYEFDDWAYVYPAEVLKPGQKKGYAGTPTFELDLQNLLSVSYMLSHLDVLQNNGSSERCQECGSKPDKLTTCDGAFPSNLGFSWPETGQAYGKQLSCKRGFICDDCNTTPESGYWYCRDCRSPNATHEDVWGNDIDEPSCLRTPGSLWALSVPVAEEVLDHPAEVWRLAQTSRAESMRDGAHRYSRYGGVVAMTTSAKFIAETRLRHMSRGNQQAVLDVLHSLHDEGALVEGSDGPLLLPRTLDAAKDRAAAAQISERDFTIHKSTFCMSALLQTKQTVSAVAGDILSILQDMLLDPRVPPESLFLEERGGDPRVYCDAAGNTLYGPEPWQTERYRNVLGSVPQGAKLLIIGLHTDGVHTTAGEKYPLSVSVENFSGDERPGERGLNKSGLVDSIDIRKPRGSDVPENLGDRQKSLKYNLLSRMVAELLGRLNALAAGPIRFLVQRRNAAGGIDFVEENLWIRIWGWRADMAEQQALLGVSSSSCPVGFCYEHATADRRGAAGTANRPYMSLEPGSACGTGLPRDVEETARRQRDAMKVCWEKGMDAGRARAHALGVKLDVQCHLSRLPNLLPHSDRGATGAFKADTLHTILTGILGKLVHVLDSIMLQYRTATADFKSSEDVRNLVDERLVLLGKRYGRPSFARSFWGNGDIGSLKGHQMLSLAECLPFTFAGCRVLVADDAVRRDALSLSDLLCRLTAELKTKQFYSDDDLAALETQTARIIGLMHKVMDHLLLEAEPETKKKKAKAPMAKAAAVGAKKEETAGPGRLFDIIKVHCLTGARQKFLRFGFSGNMDTEAGEHSMKPLQAEARSAPRLQTGRVYVDPDELGDIDPLLAKLLAHDALGAVQAEPKRGATPRRTSGPARVPQPCASNRSVVGEGNRWVQLAYGLRKGNNGPPIPEPALASIQRFLVTNFAAGRLPGSSDVAAVSTSSASSSSSSSSTPPSSLSPSTAFWFHPDAPVTSSTSDVSYHIFLAGHCVKTRTGTYAQVVLPVVATTERGLASKDKLSLVFEFVPCDAASPTYPELAVPWLVRGTMALVSLSSLVSRASVVPLFGRACRTSRFDTTAQFLVNNYSDACFAGPADRQVFMRCTHSGCGGRLPKPSTYGAEVACAVCKRTRPWF